MYIIISFAGQILKQKGEYAKAHAIFLEVQKLEPSMISLQSELAYLEDKIAKEQESEKILYAKMLGRVKHNKSKKVKIESKYKIAKGVLWTFVGGTSVAIIGILIHRFVSWKKEKKHEDKSVRKIKNIVKLFMIWYNGEE